MWIRSRRSWRIPESNIEPPPRFKTVSGKDRYISGIGKVGEQVKIYLVDVEKIVRDEDIGAIDRWRRLRRSRREGRGGSVGGP